jgi:TRAP transporter TAXI family solute receptor
MLSKIELREGRVGPFARAAALAGVCLLGSTAAFASDIIPDTARERDAFSATVEGRRVGIVTGAPGGTYIQLGSDLSRLVQSASSDAIRVIVMEGRGSVGNLQDLVFLRYTDLALVQGDVLDSIEAEDPDDYDFLKDRLRFVARFHPEIVHVLARGGPFHDVKELDGKRVAIGAAGSGTQITAPIVFEKLGVRPQYVPLHQDQALADLLSDAPKIDAMVYVAGRGSALFTRISPEMAQRIQDKGVYFVPFPAAPPADSSYVASEISGTDYPSFVEQGASVPVWSVPAVLAVYNWDPARGGMQRDRYRRLKDFIDAFFNDRARLDDGPGGFNENWCSIDLANSVGGWTRFSAAQDWLDRNAGASTAICAAAKPSCKDAFEAEMRKAGFDPASAGVAALFEDWKKRNGQTCR